MSKERVSLFKSSNGTSYLYPFILVTSLFFLWGFAHSLLDVLNKHFQDILGITRAKSGFIQAALYGGYLIMAIPAGYFMKRWGYKPGIILGLLIYALGCFMFYPAAKVQMFEFTLLCLFVIACGLTFLETAANPYSAALGPSDTSERRLNLSQSFNGLGWVFGPMVGGFLILGADDNAANKFDSMILPYTLIGFMVIMVAIMFYKVSLPDVKEESFAIDENKPVKKSMWMYPHFIFAIIVQFLYVAAQTGINSFFINYVVETMHNISDEKAAYLLSFGGMGLFFVGRMSGSIMMKWFKPSLLLAIYGTTAIIMTALVIAGLGWISVIALFITYFTMSIMFPTIFALGIKDLGHHTKKAASYLVMGVAGGAICPIVMGHIADISSMQLAFIIPLVCFVAIAGFGVYSNINAKNVL